MKKFKKYGKKSNKSPHDIADADYHSFANCVLVTSPKWCSKMRKLNHQHLHRFCYTHDTLFPVSSFFFFIQKWSVFDAIMKQTA